VFFATLAVVVLGAAGATSVFLVGSKQRRDDRRAYLAYERAVLVPLAEVRRVEREMRSGDGEVIVWLGTLTRAQAEVLAIEPPSFIRGVDLLWADALDGYARLAERLGPPPLGAASLADLARADALFDRAAERMQFHRRRLGLGATTELPDPASERTPD